MATEELQLAAIMFTDLVSYSELAQRDEALAPIPGGGAGRSMCPGNSDGHSSADSLFAIFLRASADPVTN
jgi:hypothetical protein